MSIWKSTAWIDARRHSCGWPFGCHASTTLIHTRFVIEDGYWGFSKPRQSVYDSAVIPTSQEKEIRYADAAMRIQGLLGGEVDMIAKMAGVVAILHGTLPHFYWTGFYRVVGDELVIGPYQGTPGCSRIPRGRGVCGTAWEEGTVQVVADVHAFEGHIACDARSESEIVVPVRGAHGEVVAVLDVDSTEKGAFDQSDQRWLEQILSNSLG